jgi:RNA polymerase sigma factor (sigma-70 family)
MQEKTDVQLLRDYAEQGSEAAFATLVGRYANLVYSAAARQSTSLDVAADVTQTAFIGLARTAVKLSASLSEDASIAGWLCRAARNQCLKRRRDDFRRLSREKQAMEELLSSSEPAPDWGQLRPILDDAMSELNDADHDSIVMRFFNNQDLRSVGLALGVSEDTAQKRVSRALEKLRALLSRRGIRTSGAGLSCALSTNAVQAAPPGLATTICSALPAVATGVAGTTTKTLVMTTLQKTLVATALAATIGTALYQTNEATQLRNDNERLRLEQAKSATSSHAVPSTVSRPEARQEGQDGILGAVPHSQIPRANASDDSQLVAASRVLGERAIKVRERLDKTPGKQIPELKLLTDADWLDALRDIDRLSTEEDFRRAYHQLRQQAKSKFSDLLETALKAYVQFSQGNLPTQLSQLRPFFSTPIDDAILQATACSTPEGCKTYLRASTSLRRLPDPRTTSMTRYSKSTLTAAVRATSINSQPKAPSPTTLKPIRDAFQRTHHRFCLSPSSKSTPSRSSS